MVVSLSLSRLRLGELGQQILLTPDSCTNVAVLHLGVMYRRSYVYALSTDVYALCTDVALLRLYSLPLNPHPKSAYVC